MWFSSPGCDAVIVQEPAPLRCTLAPLTVHRPFAAKETGRPEDAAASTVKSGAPKVFFAGATKAIDWSAFAIANVCETSWAGLWLASPACEAVRVHEPAPVR